jgi:hypothetical protein
MDGLRDEDDFFDRKADEESRAILRIAQAVADNLNSRWEKPFDWRSLLPKHGPGVVADAKRGTDKYLFPSWPEKLDRTFPKAYFAYSSEYEAFVANSGDDSMVSKREPPARFLAVPKTLKGPRMVASEPTSHQFIQLGLMRWMRENLPYPLHACLDFRSQEPSRVLCETASRNGDLATVDLSAASDRLSCWVVERVFRRAPALLEAFHAARTRWLINATGIGEPYFLFLRKYAPMGNGTTFPVQSIVYAIFSIAAILYQDGRRVNNQTILEAIREIRVFGDDIILPSRAVRPLATLFSEVQLEINWMKTHSTGFFRESCGKDAFQGHDVTPLYLASLELKDSPEGLVSWLDVLKNARQHCYHYLEMAMESQIPEKYLVGLPRTDRELGCLTLPSYYGIGIDFHPLTRRRYNRKLFRIDAFVLALVAKPVRGKRESDANLVQYWTDSPKPDSLWESGFVVRNRQKLLWRWVPMM